MPLTEFQAALARLLASNRSPDSYLAGGAAILLEPESTRFSRDLDFFHDSEARVAEAFASDRDLIKGEGYTLEPEFSQPGYIRGVVRHGEHATKIEWAHDSAWRFMPPVHDERVGYRLHDVDLAVNKILALAGREEVRDVLDAVSLHEEVLGLGPLCWAACGKDPGLNPLSLVALLRRRGRVRPEDLSRLALAVELNVEQLKVRWMDAIESVEPFVASRSAEEIGCLYYSPRLQAFVDPNTTDDAVPHYGRPGGILPRVLGAS